MKDFVQIGDRKFVPYIHEKDILHEIDALAKALYTPYRDKNPLIISILNGAFIFAADLIRAFDFDCEISFVQLASYHDTQSTGKVEVVSGFQTRLEGRDIIVVEDIIDTGRTLAAFTELISAQNPKSVQIVTLLDKPEARIADVQADYACFVIPDKFVIGYGLDLNGIARNLRSIYVLDNV